MMGDTEAVGEKRVARHTGGRGLNKRKGRGVNRIENFRTTERNGKRKKIPSGTSWQSEGEGHMYRQRVNTFRVGYGDCWARGHEVSMCALVAGDKFGEHEGCAD